MRILPVLAPLLVFGLVVFVHELGHFLAAKLVGVYAPVFSLGWGRRIWGFRRGETDYRLSIFPLGGYVRMASREDEAMASFEGGTTRGALEDDTTQPKGEPGVPWDPEALAPFGPKPVPSNRWFESKPLWAKVFVLLAGVTMNFILAIGVVMALVMTGGVANPAPLIGSVLPGTPAAAAGLAAGDSVLTIDKAPIGVWKDLVAAVTVRPGVPLQFVVMRAGAPVTLTVTPSATVDTNPTTGAVRSLGRIGAGGARIRLGVGPAFLEAVDGTWETVVATVDVVGGLLRGKVSPKQLGGPLMIAQASVQRAQSGGLEGVLDLLALISVNIAVLNLLPVPVLDGGQVLLATLESARGRPLGDRARGLVMYAGVGVVLLLLITTTFNDVARIGGQLLRHFQG
ncbi:MAG: site-2 protease family protein [Gemmatimonadaceae bacterium]|nr:site-2 protease family protein [Gemmatimonadaceae bacterium]